MLEKIYIYFLGLFIAIAFFSTSKCLESIENKLDSNIEEIKIEERISVLNEMNLSNDEILLNVRSKYSLTEAELKEHIKE